MGNKKTTEEILALAKRLECGVTTIGDFLRAKVVFLKSRECKPEPSRDLLEALMELSSSAMRGYKQGDNTYGLLQEQLRIISHGTLLGLLDANFFSQVGKSGLSL